MVAPTPTHFWHGTHLLVMAWIVSLTALVKLLNDSWDLWHKVTKNKKSWVHNLSARTLYFFKKILNVLQTATMERILKKVFSCDMSHIKKNLLVDILLADIFKKVWFVPELGIPEFGPSKKAWPYQELTRFSNRQVCLGV